MQSVPDLPLDDPRNRIDRSVGQRFLAADHDAARVGARCTCGHTEAAHWFNGVRRCLACPCGALALESPTPEARHE